MTDERIARVRVTNGLQQVYSDRYDGVPISLQPGEMKIFDLETAAHIFGWHPGASVEEITRYVGKRQGWNSTAHLARDDSGRTLAERMGALIKLEPVYYKVIEEGADPNAPIPADPQPQLPGEPSSIAQRYEKLQARVNASLRS
jgi:hypothetical protein